MPKVQVNCSVEKAEEDAQRYLDLTRERSWVHDGRHVVLNETTRVLWSAAGEAQPILKRGERAYPSVEFEQGTPEDSWKVQPGNPTPTQGQHATENNEEDERQVNEDDEVCDGVEKHPECGWEPGYDTRRQLNSTTS